MLAISIGNFDGVHRGHAALLRRARSIAGPSGWVVVVTFDPHPLARLRPHAVPPSLTACDERVRLLRALGADDVVVLDPTPELLQREPSEFIVELRRRVPFDAIVEGDDFRFGRARSGSVGTLREIGAREGFTVDVVDGIDVALGDQTVVRASSTMARWLVAQGRVADAARLLGRPYALVAPTAAGDRRGRTIGFPTMNLAHGAALLPADGVYGGWVTLDDGSRHVAAISVGTKPSFGASARTCEAHLPGLDLPLDRYGFTVRVEFGRWVRGQFALRSTDALVAQIGRDVADIVARAGPTIPAGVPA